MGEPALELLTHPPSGPCPYCETQAAYDLDGGGCLLCLDCDGGSFEVEITEELVIDARWERFADDDQAPAAAPASTPARCVRCDGTGRVELVLGDGGYPGWSGWTDCPACVGGEGSCDS